MLAIPLPVVGVLCLTHLLVQHAVIHWGPKRKLDLVTGVSFALLILLAPTLLGAIVIGILFLIGKSLWLLRRNQQGQRRGVLSLCFTTAQSFLAAVAAAVVFRLHLPFMLPSTAVTLYLVNTLLVSGVIALQMRQSMWQVWKKDRLWSALVATGSMATGYLLTRNPQNPSMVIAAVIPASVIYLLLKRAEVAQHATEERDLVITTIGHELKTPLTSLRGLVYMLERKYETDPEKAKASITRIKGTTKRMCELIEGLLDISHIDRGTLTLALEHIELTTIARELIVELQLISCYELEVIAKEPIFLTVDRVRITQVLSNLIQNAIRYAQGGERIEIEFARIPQYIRITVRDFGQGISEPQRKLIFDRYHQGPGVAEVNGFGLGLYLCQKIVEAHGGQITCAAPGIRGIEFRILLPDKSFPEGVHEVTPLVTTTS